MPLPLNDWERHLTQLNPQSAPQLGRGWSATFPGGVSSAPNSDRPSATRLQELRAELLCIRLARYATSPATELVALASGLASRARPGPQQPGKLRQIALAVTGSAELGAPGPQFALAPHADCTSRAPRLDRQECRLPVS
jgi:hypothetical protein